MKVDVQPKFNGVSQQSDEDVRYPPRHQEEFQIGEMGNLQSRTLQLFA
jgi:hypothetical protein